MAGLLPSFLSSSQLEISIGDETLAYAQSLSFQENMTNVPVGGIGSISYHALEPIDYAASGSMVITHYSAGIFNAIKANNERKVPENLQTRESFSTAPENPEQFRDGNSLLISELFNPINLMLSRTFDIKVIPRAINRQGVALANAGSGDPVYTMSNCRATSFRLSFTSGSLAQQIFTFICMAVIDHDSDDTTNKSLIVPVG